MHFFLLGKLEVEINLSRELFLCWISRGAFGFISVKITVVRKFLDHLFNWFLDGFGGLVVRMLASGSRFRGFKPGRSRWIFLHIKILSMPYFGGEVK
jgi:hypothetical protein